ncbi:hypothetical protein IWW50_004331 [Coemansia erecta]|nr:hypothetical protein IWW50_004331 [Coemansia erecta]
MSRLDPCMVFGYYCGSLEALIDLRSRIEMLADDGITAILSFDNGHAPSSAIPESVVLDNPVNPEPGILGNPEPRVLTKLPNDDASSINSSDAKTKSESGEIILEGECSEEEWVTEL